MWREDLDVGVLKGKILTSVKNIDNEEILFVTEDGTEYKMYHEQDCCEIVRIEDLEGDLNDLVGSPITLAEESSSDADTRPEEDRWGDESGTWTFYRFATAKGFVSIRWLGTSNGYYSESVSFQEV